MLPLLLYDIPSQVPGNAWSPNPAKTRFVLGYKGLPFKTVWVEPPDIAPVLREIGAPLNKLPDGIERYTVPVLDDPNTSAIITDSWAIAEYLDKTYPENTIFPNDSKGLIDAFYTAMLSLLKPSYGFYLLRTSEILNERGVESFVRAKEAMFGPINDWSPDGPKREAQWVAIEKYYEAAKTWYEREDGKWMMGNTFTYADILFAARSLWFKKVFQDHEWKRIVSLHEGKWESLLADVEKECNLACM